ncbi:MAG: hypothetical protein A2Y31_06795 [Spirochaetes bacterium GWC2_52_13]|nr:MAG: hypothetical protein A2Y31_06795 [Spirochaetes bacterium GWC2_52_13]
MEKSERASLLKRIDELERIVRVMREEKNREELLDLPWAGNLGSWTWNVPSNTLVCNDVKILNLGFTKEEIPAVLGYEFFTDLLHPEDYGPVMDQMRRHLAGVDPAYEVSYRIRHTDGSWRWYYDRGKVTRRDAQGEPLVVAGIVFDITKQKSMEEQLAHQNRRLRELVDHDDLTKVFSRRALYDFLKAAHARSLANGDDLAIVMLDIDHFKKINDTYGHLVGDTILKQVATLIGNTIRTVDAVGRYGGEEFLVVLDGADPQVAAQVAERIRGTIAEYRYDGGITVRISGGVAVLQGQGIDELITLADNRLYEAKRSGRNRIVGP